ncbi:hypothetical protein [Microcystis aeruginosa]|uniref:hypothetical protein n=1 Tax=Microcystis aeruginosa TaxID=1126 RepID=UPI001E4DA182|nr:hypothetical protein [Microcystis aeruginosa]
MVKVYPEIMTKIQFELSPKPSKTEKAEKGCSGFVPVIPFFFIRVTTNAGLASIRAWMSVMDLEIWYKNSMGN